MIIEVAELITKTRGMSMGYLQRYQNFNLLRRQMKYKYKRNEKSEKIMNLLVKTSSFKNISVLATPMPISLKEAFYEYRYGIYTK